MVQALARRAAGILHRALMALEGLAEVARRGLYGSSSSSGGGGGAWFILVFLKF